MSDNHEKTNGLALSTFDPNESAVFAANVLKDLNILRTGINCAFGKTRLAVHRRVSCPERAVEYSERVAAATAALGNRANNIPTLKGLRILPENKD